MNNEFIFTVKDKKLILGSNSKICFGCGENALELQEIFFEDSDAMGLSSRIGSLLGRTSMLIPICKNCKKITSFCRKKIFIWCIIFIVCLFGSMAITEKFKVKPDDQWPIFVMLGVSIFPILKIKKYWIIKDQGGAFVELVKVDDNSITLRFNSNAALSKLSAV